MVGFTEGALATHEEVASFTPLMNAKVASLWTKYVGNPTRAWWAKCSTAAAKSCGDSFLIWVQL
jgi:hypothetical protein